MRLYPMPPKEIPAKKIYEDLELPEEHDNDHQRPYVVINAVSTLDGKLSRKGVSSGIGSNVDRHAMRVIRSRVDAVLVGAGTARAEKVSLSVPTDLADWRERRGEDRQPLGVVLSRTGDVQISNPTGVDQNLLVLNETVVQRRAAGIDGYLWLLRHEHGVRRLLVEGGPAIIHTLFEERLVDELFLTLSPKIYGGESPNLLSGPDLPDPTPELTLLSIFLYNSELFFRYSCKLFEPHQFPISTILGN